MVLEREAYADVCIVQERLSQVEGHLMGGSGSPGGSDKKGRTSILEKKPDDVSTLLKGRTQTPLKLLETPLRHFHPLSSLCEP